MLSMRRTSWLHGQHSAHFTWGFSGWLMAVLTSTYQTSYEIMTQLPPESVVVFCLLFLFCNGKHLDHQVNIHNRWYMSGTEAFQSVVPRTPKLIGAWGCGGCKLPCTKQGDQLSNFSQIRKPELQMSRGANSCGNNHNLQSGSSGEKWDSEEGKPEHRSWHVVSASFYFIRLILLIPVTPWLFCNAQQVGLMY